jgi:hypothetical protein
MSKTTITAYTCDKCGKQSIVPQEYTEVKVDLGEGVGTFHLCPTHTGDLAHLLGVGGDRPRPQTKRTLKRWSMDEEQVLRENYDLMTLDDIAKQLDRSLSSVANRASLLGLSKTKQDA